MVNLRSKLESISKILAAILIFGVTQTTPITGFFGFMLAPLMVYLPLTIGQQFFFYDLLEIFRIDGTRFLGGIIFYFGLIVFSVSLIQWIKFHHEKLTVYNRGLYSKVRHPQFLGIITMTLGLTIKSLTISIGWSLIAAPFAPGSHPIRTPELVGLWFLQVLGYITFATFEERSLSQKFSEFKEYKNKVPLLLPIKNPKRIPEVLFTVLLIVGVCVILFLLPYELIRVFSYQHIPQLQI